MSESESAARAASDHDHDDAEYLRRMLPPGRAIYGTVVHVSRSGTSRTIRLFTVGFDMARSEHVIEWVPSGRIARVLRYAPDDRKRDGNRVTGGGMDMVYDLIGRLGRALWGHLPPEQLRQVVRHGDPTDAYYIFEVRHL